MPDTQRYFEWLYGRAISFVEHYRTLCSVLHTIMFFSNVPMDDNRIADAVSLRTMFETEAQADLSELREPSVLEMLVVLAQDLSFQTMDEEDIQIAFAEILGNLGLSKRIDECWAAEPFEAEHDTRLTIHRWLDREELTLRTPFPVFENGELVDTRRIELWYQMHLYNRSIDQF